jgi:hypothetical protein
MKKGTIVLALTLAIGCHAKPSPESSRQWTRVDASAAPLETARAECRKEAFEKTKAIHQESAATQAGAGIFVECMRRHGWAQTAGTTH